MLLYILQNVDGNGESEIICIWLVATEEKNTLSCLMEKFKERNSTWSDVQVVMADKDFTEREVLVEKLPAARLLICLFHTLRSFRREVSTEKMGISIGERNMSLELLQKLAYSKSEADYEQQYDYFRKSVPKSVLECFNTNWYGIRSQWVEGLKSKNATFLKQHQQSC